MSYVILARCKDLDDGRKALGVYMASGLKHTKTEPIDIECPECGCIIESKHKDLFIMSATVGNITDAIFVLGAIVSSGLDGGISIRKNK